MFFYFEREGSVPVARRFSILEKRFSILEKMFVYFCSPVCNRAAAEVLLTRVSDALSLLV